MASFDFARAKEFIKKQWDQSVIPKLKEYIAIPNTSPNYNYNDALAVQAANLLADWVNSQGVTGIKAEVRQSDKPNSTTSPPPKMTPIILVQVEATRPPPYTSVLLYGHFDKQPPMDPWTPPYAPYVPTFDESTGKLYGRGGADDGYALFALVTSILALKEQNIHHDRFVIIIEGDEESGTGDVEAYVKEFRDIIGAPSLIVCTDSGGGDWDHLWLTNSLRGVVAGNVDAKILTEAAHSGSASGIVASTFHIQRTLVDRLETDHNGVVNNPALTIPITDEMIKQSEELALILKDTVYTQFKFVATGKPISDNIATLILNNTFKPSLCITGVSGIPTIESGETGNVLRTNTTFLYSIRLPPGKNADKASDDLKAILERDQPFGAQVTYQKTTAGTGWLSPPLSEWLNQALTSASEEFFAQKKFLTQGQGGSIPLISELADLYPHAQFVVTGVLGPGSNAHGIDEFLDTNYAKGITGTISYILYALSIQPIYV